MLQVRKWKCSWSLVASIASVLALVSVVHLFLFPLVPSFDYFSARQVQNSCVPFNGSIQGPTDRVWENSLPPLDLDHRFPADSRKAVVYRNAPWKAEIGSWLSGCDAVAKKVNIVEVLIVVWLRSITVSMGKTSVLVCIYSLINFICVLSSDLMQLFFLNMYFMI